MLNLLDSETIVNNQSVIDAVNSSLDDVVLLFGMDYKVMDVNPAFARKFGFNPLNLRIEDLLSILAVRSEKYEPLKMNQDPVYRALNGERVKKEILSVTFQNKTFNLGCTAFPIYSFDSITGAISVWYELSQSEIAPALNLSHSSYRKLIDFAPLPTLVLKGRKIEYVNQSALEILNYHSEKEICSKTFDELFFSKHDCSDFFDMFSYQDVVCLEAGLLQQNGRAKDFELHGVKIEEDNLELYHVYVHEKRRTKDTLDSTLDSVGKILLRGKNYHLVAQHVLELVSKAVECDSSAVSFKLGNSFQVKNTYGFKKKIENLKVAIDDEPHALLALKERKVQIVEDTATDSRVNAGRLQEWGIKSVVIVPLYTKHMDIGVIFFNYYKKVHFTSEIIEFLYRFSGTLSLALENMELYEDYQKELHVKEENEKKLTRLNRMLLAFCNSSDAMVQAKNEFDYLSQICGTIIDESGLALTWIGFIRENLILPEVWVGPASGYIADVLSEVNHVSDVQIQKLLRRSQPLVFNDIEEQYSRKLCAEKAREHHLQSHIILPLFQKNEVFGFLNIYSFQKNAFSEEDVFLYSELSKHLSQGIQNVRNEVARKAAEKILLEREERFRFLTHKSNALICEVDHSGNIVYANEKFQELADIDRIMFEGLRYYVVTQFKNNFGFHDEFQITDTGGYEHWFICHRNSFVNTIGEQHFCLILFEITDIKSKEQQLIEYTEKLKSLNATKDKFFGIIAHDLKNPFTSLIGASELLSMDSRQLEPETVTKLGKILYETSRMGYALLQNLLDWSRSQTGAISFVPELVNISALVEKCVEDMSTSLNNKKLSVRFLRVPKSNIFADVNMISTVLRNLIGNAIKYSYMGGIIEISIHVYHSGISVHVKDNGVGISEENMNKLFRIDTNFTHMGTHKEEGTGLGLILCKEFIERHQGKIGVKSTFGKGSMFSFSIPHLIDDGHVNKYALPQ